MQDSAEPGSRWPVALTVLLMPSLLAVMGASAPSSDSTPAELVVFTTYSPETEESSVRVAEVTETTSVEVRRLAEGGANGYREVAVSPDGALVAVTANRNDTRPPSSQLLVFPIAGGSAEEAIFLPGSIGSPTWSPDSRSIAFGLDGDEEERGLYSIRADGAELRKIAGPEDYEFMPDWGCSTDPPRFLPQEWSGRDQLLLSVMVTRFEVVFTDVAVAKSDGSGLRRLVDLGENDVSPSFAPDESQVVLESDGEIWRVDSDGENAVRLERGGLPSWGSDGQIAFVEGYSADRASRLMLTDPSASQQPEPAFDHSEEGFEERLIGRSDWSPSGKTLAFLADGRSGSSRLYALRVGADQPVAVAPEPPESENVLDFDLTRDAPATGGRRFGGDSRYETAEELSRSAFHGERLQAAVITRGDLFPDALGANYQAGYLGGTVLLTTRERLEPTALRELQRLDPVNVRVMGSPAAVSDAVIDELRANGFDPARFGGEDRYETNYLSVAGTDRRERVLLANGEDFPDALAAGPVAFRDSIPVLLTRPDEAAEATVRALREVPWPEVIVIGGPNAVSQAVVDEVVNTCPPDLAPPCRTATRVGGANRNETAFAIADHFRLGLGHVNLARGDTYPDALAGGPHAGRENAPIVFTVGPSQLGSSTEEWLRRHAAQIDSIDVFGSPIAVYDKVWRQARYAAD